MGGGNTGVYRRMTTNSMDRCAKAAITRDGGRGARELPLAAAAMWRCRRRADGEEQCHPPHASGRRTTYGALAAKAAQIKLPDPAKIKIKGPDQFTLIGTEQKNLDVPLKVTGKAIYGIDVDLPGMLYAAVKACPVFGGTVKSYDFNVIKDRPGVHAAVKIEGKGLREDADFGTSGREYRYAAVAVVADTWWRAKTALDLLPIEWDVGSDGHRSSTVRLDPTVKQPGTIVLEDGGSYAAAKSKAAKVVEATMLVPYPPMPAWSRATPPRW